MQNECSEMTSNNIVTKLVKGEKLDDKYYDIWNKKMLYLFNDQDVLETLIHEINPPTPSKATLPQHHRNIETYQNWVKRIVVHILPYGALCTMTLPVSLKTVPLPKKCGTS